MLQSILTPTQIAAAQSLISQSERIVIVTHLSPDGDAMGSSLGMYHYLIQLGKRDVCVIVPNAFPSFLSWMPGAEGVIKYDTEAAVADVHIEQADLIICTDFNEPKRIGILGEKVMVCSCPKILFDHHLHPQDFADVTMSYPAMPSASELVYRFIHQSFIGGYNTLSTEQLSLSSATCLYTGMMTDTGNFSFNSNYADMYTIIGQLVSRGVDKDAVYNAVFNNHSEDRMRLMGYCLYRKMRIFPAYHTALIYLTRQELYRFNFQSGDAEGIVNIPLQIGDIYYSCFMREDRLSPEESVLHHGAKSKVKISFRSQGDRPVNIFARDIFQGGGHANASGGEFYGSVTRAVEQFIQHYPTYFRQD